MAPAVQSLKFILNSAWVRSAVVLLVLYVVLRFLLGAGSYAFLFLLSVLPALFLAFCASFFATPAWKRYTFFLITFIVIQVGFQAYFAHSVKLTLRGGHDGFVDLYVSGKMTLAGFSDAVSSSVIVCATVIVTEMIVRSLAQRL
jgi:hypothetical protein